MQPVALIFGIVLVYSDHIMLATIGFFSLLGLSLWLSVAHKPSYPEVSLKSGLAAYRAASDRLGFKVSLIWVKLDQSLWSSSPWSYSLAS
jgi:hypothetical protein